MLPEVNIMSQAWLSIVEYARAFSISDMTVRRRIKTGKLRSEMRDGKYYVPVEVDENGQYKRIGTLSNNTNSTKRPESRSGNINPLTGSTMIVSSRNSTATVEPKPRQVTQPTRQSHQKQAYYQQQPTNHLVNSELTPQAQSELSASGNEKVNIEVQNLLKLCNTIISETKKKEGMIKSRFEAQLNALNNEIQVKNIENQQLQQQLEDLTLLIKIMEQS